MIAGFLDVLFSRDRRASAGRLDFDFLLGLLMFRAASDKCQRQCAHRDETGELFHFHFPCERSNDRTMRIARQTGCHRIRFLFSARNFLVKASVSVAIRELPAKSIVEMDLNRWRRTLI